MKPKITIFTCSYNKPQYVTLAIYSVLNQTFRDFEYIILENSTDGLTKDFVRKIKDDRIKVVDVFFSDRWREKFYAESRLKNRYFPKARGKYIMVLSDDDILDSLCFQEHIEDFELNKEHKMNYHSYKIIYLGSNLEEKVIKAEKVFGKINTPNISRDGGAIMFEKDLLKKIVPPFFKLDWGNAHISDRLFINMLAKVADLHPIESFLHTKRVTSISTHQIVKKIGENKFIKKNIRKI